MEKSTYKITFKHYGKDKEKYEEKKQFVEEFVGDLVTFFPGEFKFPKCIYIVDDELWDESIKSSVYLTKEGYIVLKYSCNEKEILREILHLTYPDLPEFEISTKVTKNERLLLIERTKRFVESEDATSPD